MALLKFNLVIEYEDETTENVTMDQRDTALWEIQKFGGPTQSAMEQTPSLFFRWNAWHALKRTNRTTEPWEVFDARTVEVLPEAPSTDDDEEDDPSPNPGDSAAHDEG